MSKYDSRSKRYIAVSQAARLASTAAAAPDLIQSSVLDGSSGAIILAAAPMTYWDGIFQKSVDRFKALWVNAPKDREKSGLDYGIRDRSTWEDVYSQLQKAREFYDGDTKGLWGRYAKGYTRKRRWFVDHSGPVARQAVKFVPQMDYATPVIAAVQVLVDVSPLDACVKFLINKSGRAIFAEATTNVQSFSWNPGMKTFTMMPVITIRR